MSAYYVVIGNQVEGPLTLAGLRAMNLPKATQISKVETPDQWLPWGDLERGLARAEGKPTTLPEELPRKAPKSSPYLLIKLRSQTAYPILRFSLGVLLGFNLLAMVIGLLALITGKFTLVVFVVVLGGSIAWAFTCWLASVFLDIADVLIRKTE